MPDAEPLNTAPRPIRFPYWHVLPFTVYLVTNAILMRQHYDKLPQIQQYLTPLPLVLMSLATYRIANIIANERVTRIIRAPFVNVKRENGEEVEVPKPKGIENTMGSLLYCPSCVGVWVGTTIIYLFIFEPTIAWVVCGIFTLSAMERFLTGLIAWLQSLT